MDPRKLLYLATVVEEQSLTRAAKVLGVSQPALSKSMDRLESELGMTLLERGSTGITPTSSGKLVYAYARQIRDGMRVAEARLQGSNPDAGVITLGTLPSLSNSLVPLAVGRWKQRHPNVLLRVVEKIQIELLLGLHRGDFDFIVAQTEFYDVAPEGLKQRVLFRDRLCVYARHDHPLFLEDEPSWRQLAAYPWVFPMVGWSQRTLLEKLVASEGVEPPRDLVECGSIGFTKSLIATSDHLGLLPAHCATLSPSVGSIQALPISAPALKRDIAVIFRERTSLMEAAHDLVTEVQAVGNRLST